MTARPDRRKTQPARRGAKTNFHHFRDTTFRHVQGDKNTRSLAKARQLIDEFIPDVILLEDYDGAGSRRAPRIENLIDDIAVLANERGIRTKRYSRSQIQECFAEYGATTKYEIATAISQSLPEFPPQLPPQRKIWLPEDYRMSIFDAVSLIFTYFFFPAIKPNTASEDETSSADEAQPDDSLSSKADPTETATQ